MNLDSLLNSEHYFYITLLGVLIWLCSTSAFLYFWHQRYLKRKSTKSPAKNVHPEKKRLKRRSKKQKVLRYFAENPSKEISLDEVRLAVKGVKKSLYGCVHALQKEGLVKRVRHGLYKYKGVNNGN